MEKLENFYLTNLFYVPDRFILDFFDVTVEMLFDSIHKENLNNLFDVLWKALSPKIAAKKPVCLQKVHQNEECVI